MTGYKTTLDGMPDFFDYETSIDWTPCTNHTGQ
jgi:hypothetical protein